MIVLAFIIPLLLGVSLVLSLLPRLALSASGVVMLFSLAIGLGLGITSASSFAWLALVGQPGLGYFTLEFALDSYFYLEPTGTVLSAMHSLGPTLTIL
jgi:hypothetical protein